MKKYIDEILNLSEKSLQKNDVPVGAIVVYNNKIIGKGYNNRIETNDVTSHAEINAIRNAEKNIGDWRLNECDLYVTLEPCDMCIETIKAARIKNVYYLLSNNDKNKYSKTNICMINENDIQKNVEKYKKNLSDFFLTKLNR